MRALFVVPHPEFDGAARTLVDGAIALASRGHGALVACLAARGPDRVARAHGLETVALTADANMWRRARELRRAIGTPGVDLMVVGSERDQLAAARAATRSSRSVVVRRVPSDQDLERHWRARMAERRVRVGYLVANSATASTPDHDIIRATVCVRVPEHPADVGDAAAPRLVCAAGPVRTRELSALVRAFAMVRERVPRLALSLVGGAARDGDVQLHAASLGVAEHVDWVHDPIAQEDAMRRGTVGCVTGLGDDAILGYLDLMAAGIPLIAHRVPPVESYVSHGIHGVLMPDLDPARMASELAVLLASAERRTAMGTAARARVERDFSDRVVASVLEQTVRRVRDRTPTAVPLSAAGETR